MGVFGKWLPPGVTCTSMDVFVVSIRLMKKSTVDETCENMRRTYRVHLLSSGTVANAVAYYGKFYGSYSFHPSKIRGCHREVIDIKPLRFLHAVARVQYYCVYKHGRWGETEWERTC